MLIPLRSYCRSHLGVLLGVGGGKELGHLYTNSQVIDESYSENVQIARRTLEARERPSDNEMQMLADGSGQVCTEVIKAKGYEKGIDSICYNLLNPQRVADPAM